MNKKPYKTIFNRLKQIDKQLDELYIHVQWNHDCHNAIALLEIEKEYILDLLAETKSVNDDE